MWSQKAGHGLVTKQQQRQHYENIKNMNSLGVFNYNFKQHLGASLLAQMVKCLPTMRLVRVRAVGREDPLEKEMATHFSILAWKIPWTEDSGMLQESMGWQRVGHD